MQRIRLAGALALAVLAISAVRPVPSQAASYSVSLTASPATLEVGYTTTLTVTVSPSLAGSRYTAYIYDGSDPSSVRTCLSTCTFKITHLTPGSHTYTAYVARTRNNPTYPPRQVVATSAPVTVTWTPTTFTVKLEADGTWVQPSTTVTLTAQTNKPVDGSVFVIQIYDQASRTRMKLCTSGSTCTFTVQELGPQATRSFQAFVSSSSATSPPPNVQASSALVSVTWSPLPDPSRPPNIGGGDVTGTVHLDGEGIPPINAPCRPTSFEFQGESVSAWVRASGHAYTGPVSITASGGSVCETASAGGGLLTVSASGSSPVGSLTCGLLTGSFTRVETHVELSVLGDCVVNGQPAIRVNFRAYGEFVPTNEGAAVSTGVTEAAFAGAFAVLPA